MPKFLYYPTVPFTITQPFGTNPAMYAQFGIKGHNGLDIKCYHGQPLYASHDGLAYYSVDDSEGHGVVIRTNEKYTYNGEESYFKTIYWHLCTSQEAKFASPVWRYVKDNHGAPMPVKAGDLIGFADNTGFSTGDHLHFALKPQALNEENGAFWNAAQNNGYAGAIDPMPYFNGIYATNAKYVLEIYKSNISILTFIRDWWTLYRAGKLDWQKRG